MNQNDANLKISAPYVCNLKQHTLVYTRVPDGNVSNEFSLEMSAHGCRTGKLACKHSVIDYNLNTDTC